MAERLSTKLSGKIQITVLLLWAAAATSVLHGETSTKFGNHKVFAKSLQKAAETRLFEGLPHPVFRTELYQNEFKTKKTVTLHGFHFYAQPLPLKDADSRTLAGLLRDRKSLRRFSGPKACGGFHPDYVFEWRTAGEIYQALICFGCHEIKFFGPKLELYCDMSDDAYEPLFKLLAPYQTNRPERLRH